VEVFCKFGDGSAGSGAGWLVSVFSFRRFVSYTVTTPYLLKVILIKLSPYAIITTLDVTFQHVGIENCTNYDVVVITYQFLGSVRKDWLT
jgi:hypothetical protein